jgi:glycosyltransferase involved in cell wall biosynthesis
MASSSIFIYDNIPSLGAPGGVARYFRHISDGLISYFGGQATIYSPQMRNYGSARHIHALPLNFRGMRWLDYFLASWTVGQRPAAIYYSPYFGNVRTTAAQVFTVYDMIYELKFRRTRDVQAFIDEKRRCIENATLLIAISQSTAHDIITCYPHVDPAKIIFIWLGVDEFFFDVSRIPSRVGKPYFLYVGSRVEYKNFERALRAFGEAGLAKDFNLRVISPDHTNRFTIEETALIRRYNIENNVDLRLAVNETELRDSYAGATAFVYPSVYEGFGLPVLEALASGTLVTASNAASIPEVAGDTALYFDPLSVDSIAEALLRMAALSDAERHIRVAQGIIHARQFSWARCQQQTIEAIARLMPS